MVRAALLLVAALVAASPAWSEELPALFRVTGVSANDSLNVREKPDPDAAVVGTLAPDAVDIEVMALSKEGSWAEINMDDRAAWVAFRFLERQDRPSWHDASVPLSCYGTEPFWGFEIRDGEGRYDSPEGAEPARRELGRAVILYHGTEPEDAVLGLNYEDAFAVIRPEACSDGMSDRANGLAIDLFIQGKDGLGGLTGCCALIR